MNTSSNFCLHSNDFSQYFTSKVEVIRVSRSSDQQGWGYLSCPILWPARLRLFELLDHLTSRLKLYELPDPLASKVEAIWVARSSDQQGWGYLSCQIPWPARLRLFELQDHLTSKVEVIGVLGSPDRQGWGNLVSRSSDKQGWGYSSCHILCSTTDLYP